MSIVSVSFKIASWGPGVNSLEVAAGQTSLGGPTGPSQYFTDDVTGDTALANSSNNTIYPNAAICMGFSGGLTFVALAHSVLNSNVPIAIKPILNQLVFGSTKTTTILSVAPANNQTLTIPDSGVASSSMILANSASVQIINSVLSLNGNVTINGQITLSPPLSGNLSSASLTETTNAAFSVRSFLTGFISTVETFLSNSTASHCVIHNGVSNAAVCIGFGTGSTSSVVINLSRTTFNTPATITGFSN